MIPPSDSALVRAFDRYIAPLLFAIGTVAMIVGAVWGLQGKI